VRACASQLACVVLESMLGMRWHRPGATHKRVKTVMKKNAAGELVPCGGEENLLESFMTV